MPLLIAVLVFLLAGAVLMAVELLRPRPAQEGGLDLNALRSDYARPDPYAPMAKLLSDEDDQYLRGQSWACEHLRCRLRKQRRRALRFYVRRMGEDFSRTWRLCKLLAPISEDHDFVIRLASAAIRFHSMHLLVSATLTIGAEGLVRQRLSDLAEMGVELRATAHTLLDSAATWNPSATPAA